MNHVNLMNHQLASIYRRSTTQCYNVWQWKDKEKDGVNSQREEEEEEWGCVAEELGGKTEEEAEEAEDICTILMR